LANPQRSDNDDIICSYTITIFNPANENFWLDKGLSAAEEKQPDFARGWRNIRLPCHPLSMCAKMLMAAAEGEEEELNTNQRQQFYAAEIYIPLDRRQGKYIMGARIIFAHTSTL